MLWDHLIRIRELINIPVEDIDRDAKYLRITPEQFIDVYLEKEEYGINYQIKHKPCDFLQENGNCKLGDCKLDSCKNIRIPIN